MIFLEFYDWLEYNYDELICAFYESGSYYNSTLDSFLDRQYEQYLMKVI